MCKAMSVRFYLFKNRTIRYVDLRPGFLDATVSKEANQDQTNTRATEQIF